MASQAAECITLVLVRNQFSDTAQPMKLCFATLSIAAGLTVAALAQASNFHLLKPHETQPGEVIQHQSVSDSQNGTITVDVGSKKKSGRISIKRSRTLERRMLGSGAKAKLQYRTLAELTTTTTEYGKTKDTNSKSGILLGKTVSGFRDNTKLWRLFLESGSAGAELTQQISELEAYENRRWFLSQPVRIGQSWPINPAFIRHLTERDLGESEVKAAMTFKSIETIDDEPSAVLTFKIETLGKNIDANQELKSAARISLNGVIYLSLKTMLDKKSRMLGTLTTMANEDGRTTVVSLPVDMTVEKSIR